MNEQKKEMEFVKSNIYSMYEWICTLEDSCKRFKGIVKKLGAEVGYEISSDD